MGREGLYLPGDRVESQSMTGVGTPARSRPHDRRLPADRQHPSRRNRRGRWPRRQPDPRAQPTLRPRL